MKKPILGTIALVVALSVSSATAFAACPGHGRNFVDANGDGICDNVNRMCIYTDADQDGVCDICGTNHIGCTNGNGTAFVDANGDGICDNCGIYHRCGMTGGGCGRGSQKGRGNGCRGGRCR